ncbi:uncharacterized protein LOC141524055 [Cotesia typhae]|uniref:uncharacterized protein LOC141524055 n=1 Tax=Cotesia typhae TaxID=2053667 RepID=UPI003D684415
MESLSRPLVFLLSILALQNIDVDGHGRLMDPPSRNSMWRFGYPNPVNYNDNELFCGGYAVHWVQNEGKCGVCGDAYHLSHPRPHEAGGEFARGTIVRRYTAGQDIDIEVELTANHQGRFELNLCPHNNPSQRENQECFDKYPLYLSGIREPAFIIPEDSPKKAIFNYRVTLPPFITCSQCVIQWNYLTGNMWGTCENGTEAVGCGKPETFRNCADVNIVTSTSGVPPMFVHQYNPFLLYYQDYRTSGNNNNNDNIYPLVIRAQTCQPRKLYRFIPGMNDWCLENCLRYPPNCPQTVCSCPEQCNAVGEFSGRKGADVYCMDKCLVNPPDCPADRCQCY